MHGDDITRLGTGGGTLNCPKRSRFCARVCVIAIRSDMEVGGSRNGNKCESA